MKTEGETKHGIIANLLVRSGIVDAASLDRAVQIQTAKGGTLPRILSSLGLADEEKACATIADGLRLSYLEPDAVSGLGVRPVDLGRARLRVDRLPNAAGRRVPQRQAGGRGRRVGDRPPVEAGACRDRQRRR